MLWEFPTAPLIGTGPSNSSRYTARARPITRDRLSPFPGSSVSSPSCPFYQQSPTSLPSLCSFCCPSPLLPPPPRLLSGTQEELLRQGQEFARQANLPFIAASAKDGSNVESVGHVRAHRVNVQGMLLFCECGMPYCLGRPHLAHHNWQKRARNRKIGHRPFCTLQQAAHTGRPTIFGAFTPLLARRRTGRCRHTAVPHPSAHLTSKHALSVQRESGCACVTLASL